MKSNVPKQLYQLQETDLEIESSEQAIAQITGQLGESKRVLATRQKLAQMQQDLEQSKSEQRSIEVEASDLTAKTTASEKDLYSGRIHNPKELVNLQAEIEALKNKRRQLDDKALEIMGKVDQASKDITALKQELEALEEDWQKQQHQLSAHLEQYKNKLAGLNQKRQVLVADIEPPIVQVYEELRKQKRTAIAKVEQGVCRGCRISLPVNELQSVRGGRIVRCSSCGRLLFLA